MKKIIIFLSLIISFSCNKKKEVEVVNITPTSTPQIVLLSSKILVLKVDYLTYTFEGGKELNFSQSLITPDTIPFKTVYNPPGDFGDITLSHKLTGDSLFHGSIIWMGKGKMTYPSQLDTSTTFAQISNPLAQPLSSRFQSIFYHPGTLNISSLWNSINKLKAVQDYLPFNKKIGVLCYTPSVGLGNPADWDWFIFLSN